MKRRVIVQAFAGLTAFLLLPVACGGDADSGRTPLPPSIVSGSPVQTVLATEAPPEPTRPPIIRVDTDADVVADDGDCTLREAIINALEDSDANSDCESGQGADRIVFDGLGPGTIVLSTDLPEIDGEAALTIDGGNTVTIDGDGAYSIFSVTRSSLTLRGLTITGGVGSKNAGGGIRSENSTITLVNVTVIGNAAPFGGGGILQDGGSLKVSDSLISGNSAERFGGGVFHASGSAEFTRTVIESNQAGWSGGGIFNSAVSGTLTLNESAVRKNTALSFDGGGIAQQEGGQLDLLGVTVSQNMADGSGGGIYVRDGSARLSNSTVSGNISVGASGGGIADAGGSIVLVNTTVTANNIFGVSVVSGTLELSNSIVADQLNTADCWGEVASLGGNLDSDGSCSLDVQKGDVVNGRANLGPLADNGGPTETHELLASSDALDAGDDTTCAADPVNGVDQRGITRPQGAGCDIGAVEQESVTTTGVAPSPTPEPQPGTIIVELASSPAGLELDVAVSGSAGCAPQPESFRVVSGSAVDVTCGDGNATFTISLRPTAGLQANKTLGSCSVEDEGATAGAQSGLISFEIPDAVTVVMRVVLQDREDIRCVITAAT